MDEDGAEVLKRPIWIWEDGGIRPQKVLPMAGFVKLNENSPYYSQDMLLKIESETEFTIGELPNSDAITSTFWLKVIPFTLSELNTFALLQVPLYFSIRMNVTTDADLNYKIITISFIRQFVVIYNISHVSVPLDEGGWHFYSMSTNKHDKTWSLISNKFGTRFMFASAGLGTWQGGHPPNILLLGNNYAYISQIKIWNKLFTPGYIYYQKDYVSNILDTNLITYWKLDANSGNSIYNQINNKSMTIPKGTAFWDSTQKSRELLKIGEIKYNNIIGNVEDYTYVLEPESPYIIPINGPVENLWISFFYKTEEPSTELEIEFPGKSDLNVAENTVVITKILTNVPFAKFTLNIDYPIGFNSWTHILIGLNYSNIANVVIKCQIIQCSTSLIQVNESRSMVNKDPYFFLKGIIKIQTKYHAAALTHFTIWNQTNMPTYYRYFKYIYMNYIYIHIYI